MQKWNLREKLGKKNLDWKSQPLVKVNGLVNDDVSRYRGRWRQRMTWWWRGRWRHLGLMSAEEHWRVAARGGSWRRVTVTPRLLVARGGAWEVRWRLNFTESEIEEISFWWCNLWSDRRSGNGGGGKAVVFDVLKSWWRQWCCSQQRLQMTPKKTRLLKSGTPND